MMQADVSLLRINDLSLSDVLHKGFVCVLLDCKAKIRTIIFQCDACPSCPDYLSKSYGWDLVNVKGDKGVDGNVQKIVVEHGISGCEDG